MVKKEKYNMENNLKPPTKEESLKLIIDFWDDIYPSSQGQNLINEVCVCNHYGLNYVDANGWDAEDPETGEKIELKATNALNGANSRWGGCGDSKLKSDWYILWDKITGNIAKVKTKIVHENLQGTELRANFNPKLPIRSKHIKTVTSWFK
tara:strand:- start:72 stop:524 length:453 start_codon:yes stop_codon:yes gene_type:complete